MLSIYKAIKASQLTIIFIKKTWKKTVICSSFFNNSKISSFLTSFKKIITFINKIDKIDVILPFEIEEFIAFSQS